MPKHTDEDIRNMSKITCKIAADYLGISPMAVLLVIGLRRIWEKMYRMRL